MIQVSSLKTSFGNFKHDISDVTDPVFAECCKYIYNFTYKRLLSVDPARFLKSQPYNITALNSEFAFPSDFRDIRQTGCGLYEILNATLAYDAQTVNYTVGNSVLGGTSSATATISADTDSGTTGTLTLIDIHGNVTDNEVLAETGSGTGSASVNGSPSYTLVSEEKLGLTKTGSSGEGFYFTASGIVFTGITDKNFLLKYAPKPFQITSVNDYFSLDGTSTGIEVIKDEHQEFLLRAVDLYYAQWEDDGNYEQITDFRLARALGDILEDTRGPKVHLLDDYNKNY